MKCVKFTSMALLLAIAGAMSSSALAYGYGHHHHGGARVGVFVGGPVFGFGYPYYGYPGYAYGYGGYGAYGPTTVITTPAAPPVYIEQGSAAVPGPASDGNWYYCRNPDGYYPYVKQCAEAWQRVPSQPAAR